jgi:hypothetical protein
MLYFGIRIETTLTLLKPCLKEVSMLRISKNLRDWRLLIWILLLISVFGPWVFDNIYVPSEYPCSIRLRENICGSPVTGVWILSALFGLFCNSILELAKGAAVTFPLVRDISIGLIPFALVLPFFSLYLMIVSGGSRPRLVFHMIACSVAAGVGLMLGLIAHTNRFWLLWGVWLYVGLLASALILEVVVLVGKMVSPAAEQPGG